MKMKKLLATALAVCMLLTMLPISVFAAGKTVIDLSIVDDEIVVKCDGVEVPFNELVGSWKGSNWEFGKNQNTLWLDSGEFEVNNDVGVMNVWIFPEATLAGGSLGGAEVTNDGGTITGGTFENDVYNQNKVGYVGTIKGGTFEANVENGGVIEGGTFTGGGYVDNEGTISGGTFKSGTEPYNYAGAEISGGTFDDSVWNQEDATISGGIFNDEVTNDGEITGGTFVSPSYIRGKKPVDGADVTYIEEDVSEKEDFTPVEAYENLNTVKVKIMFEDEKAPLPTSVPVYLWDTIGLVSLEDDLIFDGNKDNYEWYMEDKSNATTSNEWLVEFVLDKPCSLEEDLENLDPAYLYYSIDVPADYEVVKYDLDDENGWNTVTLKYTGKVKEPVREVEYEEETYDIVVRVKFDGVDEDEIDFVNAQLLKNGKAYKKAVKVDEKDEWRHEWTDLDDSSKIEWTVTADEIEGYNMKIENVRANYWTITLSKGAVEKANPETGADSFVGVAVALAVCSAVCGAALSLKK